MDDLRSGSTFADHEIVAVAGRGGMGVVYRARHVPLKREVALKVISPELSAEAEFRHRFQRECEAAASIQHPNVVTVYHAGEQDGRLYVTMRFVEGTDLAQEIAAHGALAPDRAVGLIEQIAQGLDAAHRRGLVHRDVKPANVLIDRSGAALLTDFGVTKNLRSESTHTGTGGFVGTFDYAAPEQFKGERPDARADVYSLGCVLFEALTGSVPFPAGANAAKMFGHVAQPPPPLPSHFPEALAAVVTKAMAKEPEERFASAGEFGAAARAALPRESTPPPARIPPLAPPPGLTAESGRGPFVGRADELKRLRRRLQGALRGERQFVVIAGEPGIGKSRLVAEFAGAAHADGASVLYGRSDPESLVPYQPFIGALQQRLALPLAFPEELAPELSELGRFIPALREHAAVGEPFADDPETRRWRLFEAVTRILAFAARQHPLVLVLDDLEYADPSTALLLAHVVNDPEPVRLLVLGTLRELGEQIAEPLADLLTRQRRQPSFERIALAGLDASETEALIEAHGGSPAALAHLRDQTAGNPFFLEELLRDDDAEGVPEGVKTLIARRLAALDALTIQVLSAAAVVGREFGLDVLEELVDGDVLSALEQAEAAGLVREVEGDVDRFAFAHALVRETLYEEQSASRRVRAHYKIAQALEAGGRATPAQLAHHYRESRHLDADGKAIEYLERAGASAATALAYEESVGHYRNAVAVKATPELLLALGDAESRAGDPAARSSFLRAAELARASGDSEQLARAALGFAGHHAAAVLIDRESIALLEEALAAQGDSEGALVATLLALLARNPRRTFELSSRALELARASGDTKALVAALESRHAALLHAEYLPERLRVGEELLAIARRRGDRELEGLTHHLRIRDLLEAAEFAAAHTSYDALRALADELRQPLYRHFAAVWEALWLQCEGDMEGAAKRSREAFEFGQRAHVRSAAAIFASQELARRFRGDVTVELVEHIESLLERNPGLKVWRAMLAQVYWRVGDRERGTEEFERLAVDDFAGVPRDMLWLSTLCLAAEACELLGDADRARVLYTLLAPYRERHVQGGVASSSGSAERFLGLLALAQGDLDRAQEHLQAALAANEAWGLRHVLPVTRYDLARTLLARGPDERAQELLRAAVPEAEALGMGPLAASARARLLDPVEHG